MNKLFVIGHCKPFVSCIYSIFVHIPMSSHAACVCNFKASPHLLFYETDPVYIAMFALLMVCLHTAFCCFAFKELRTVYLLGAVRNTIIHKQYPPHVKYMEIVIILDDSRAYSVNINVFASLNCIHLYYIHTNSGTCWINIQL